MPPKYLKAGAAMMFATAANQSTTASAFIPFSFANERIQYIRQRNLSSMLHLHSSSYLDSLSEQSPPTIPKVAAVPAEENEGISLAIGNNVDDEECILPEDVDQTKQLLQKVKEAGTAGAISYALWELVFWAASIPVCSYAFYQYTGHWPDFSNKEDVEKLGAEAFAFVNVARFAVPLRIGLALSTAPWIKENVLEKYFAKKDNDGPPICEEEP